MRTASLFIFLFAMLVSSLPLMGASASHSRTSAREYYEIAPDNTPALPGAFYYEKPYKIQWWYFTGHLFDDKGREFGYELTFFVFGIQRRHYLSRFGVNNIYVTHFAISDIEHDKFYFTDMSDTGAFGLAGARDDRLAVWAGETSLNGSPQMMHIRASDSSNKLDLMLSPEKPLVLNGDRGYSRKSATSPYQASFYFSYTRLKTTGTLTVGNRTINVSGESWFDREILSRDLGEGQQGWDWFSIQLDDRREIMLYLLRNKDGSADPFSSGTLVYDNGSCRHLQKNDFSIVVLRHYSSKKTGARYPSEWEIRIPSEKVSLKIIPLIEDQECVANFTTGNRYWEGTCRVEGTARGRAYVELTGY
jgi:predicted secreted hydrolase